jgi:hypothetical protein
VLKKKQWSGGSQKFLYPNPKISQSLFVKKTTKICQKRIFGRENHKKVIPLSTLAVVLNVLSNFIDYRKFSRSAL